MVQRKEGKKKKKKERKKQGKNYAGFLSFRPAKTVEISLAGLPCKKWLKFFQEVENYMDQKLIST